MRPTVEVHQELLRNHVYRLLSEWKLHSAQHMRPNLSRAENREYTDTAKRAARDGQSQAGRCRRRRPPGSPLHASSPELGTTS